MEVFPSPVFEGSEKRLEVDFSSGPGTGAGGLRALTRAQLDFMLSKVRPCRSLLQEVLNAIRVLILTCHSPAPCHVNALPFVSNVAGTCFDTLEFLRCTLHIGGSLGSGDEQWWVSLARL
jgi:hypothetical protein